MSTFLTFHPSVSHTCQQVTTTPKNSSPISPIFLKTVLRYNTRYWYAHPSLAHISIPEGLFAIKIGIRVFKKQVFHETIWIFFFRGRGEERWKVGGKLRKFVSTTSTVTILFLLLSSSTLSQITLAAILEMLFVSFCECSAVLWIRHTLKSNANVLCMERNKPRWFPHLWSVLCSCCFLRTNKAWTCHVVSIYNMSQTNIHMVNRFISATKQVFSPKVKGAIVIWTDNSQKTLTSSWANTFKIPPTHNPPCPSTTSHSELKLYVFPSFNKMPDYSSRGSHVSNHREAGPEEKSTWEKTHLCPHPFCWSGHEQTACFHCRGNPFHFQLSGCWNLHTLPESEMVTANKTPSPVNWEE